MQDVDKENQGTSAGGEDRRDDYRKDSGQKSNGGDNFITSGNTINTTASVIGNQAEKVSSQKSSYHMGGLHFNKVDNLLIGDNQGIDEGSKSTFFETLDRYIHPFSPNNKISKKIINENILIDIQTFISERIVFIDSYDEDVMLASVTKLASHEKLKETEAKRLNFDRGDKTRTDISLQIIMDEIFNAAKNILLIIFLNNHLGARNFINTVLNGDFKAGFGGFQKDLFEKNCFIVLATSQAEHIRTIEVYKQRTHLTRFHIPFVDHMISSAYDIVEADKIVRLINEQRNKNLWPKNDEDFFTEFVSYWEEGPENFREIILDKDKNEDSSIEDIFQKNKQDSSGLVMDEDKLLKYVSYVAANFEGLSVSEFQHVVHALLSDPAKTEFVTNPFKEDEKIEKPLLARWNDTADSLLRKLNLKETLSTHLDGKVLVFKRKSFGKQFKQEFLETWGIFSQRQFDYLFFDKGLLFRQETPVRVLENFIRLSAEVANNEPDLYCQRLLIYTTVLILSQEVNIEYKIDLDDEDIESAFEDFIEQMRDKKIELNVQKIDAFRKIGLLLAQMYSFPALRNYINDYFNFLFDQKFHTTVYFFVRYLRNVQDFETLYWIRQLLDRAPIAIAKDVNVFLIQFIYRDSVRSYELLKTVKGWAGSDMENASNSANAGLCSILGYLSTSINKTDFSIYGVQPIKFGFFTGAESVDELNDKLTFIVEWLFRPDLKKAYEVLESFFQRHEDVEFYEEIHSGLIVFTLAILDGNKITAKENVNKPNPTVGTKFIEIIESAITKTQRKEIKEGFKRRKDFYADMVQQARDNTKDKEMYIVLNEASKYLLNYFNRSSNFNGL